ncbi:MAG: trehalose-6-phosphate synthase [Geminicoccaceae bacterium]|nr:MAG: trehalose-6-phosphate synthase [Geminicoccaceae bacterium]
MTPARGKGAAAQPAHGGRLVVVSNRVTVIRGKQATQAGGLAVGLLAALKEAGGLWFGWSGETTTDAPGPVRTQTAGGIGYALTDLSVDDLEDYYNNFANRTLWPLFHYRIDLATYEPHWYAAYRRVNRFFAERLKALLRPDDLVWIHDYHLIPLAAELRRLGVQNRLAFFLHIPFPAPELYVTMPWQRELALDLCQYDVVGFQTPTDLRQFKNYVELELGRRFDADGWTHVEGRHVLAAAVPIGIEAEEFAQMPYLPEAQRQRQRLKEAIRGRRLIIGVDRLDYTKGIAERLKSFLLLLETLGHDDKSTSFMQISAPSRSDVPEYVNLRVEVETLAGHINGRFSDSDYVPLRYINRSFSRTALAGFFHLSAIGLVTPLRDGMNLVAKEYVAAQNPDDPGVLVLSRFAGAAGELDGALIVNPYDLHQVARAMQAGLGMPLDERKDRWERMMAKVRHFDIRGWWTKSMRLLREATPPQRES